MFLGDLLAQIGIVRAVRVDDYRVGAMVELVDHAALIERKVQILIALPKAVALHRVVAFGLQIRRRSEQAGVVGHIEHPHVPDRPRPANFVS